MKVLIGILMFLPLVIWVGIRNSIDSLFKKLFVLLLLLICSSCVNGKCEIPDQRDQDKTGIVTLLEFTF